MPVAVTIDIPGGNEQFTSRWSPGSSRAASFPRAGWCIWPGPTESCWRVINVVPSQEQFEVFAREKLTPAVQQAENVTPQLAFFPVYRLIRA